MNQALAYFITNLAPLAPSRRWGRGRKPGCIMKRRLKNTLWLLAFLYWSYACYNRFNNLESDARNLMEWVGVAGKSAGNVAAGMMK